MEPAAFAKLFPRLYHVTFAGNLESIRTHGLHSAASLAQLYGFSDEERLACLTERRRCNQDLHGITLRDQGQALPARMKSCLVNISIAEWFTLLNSKVFFFLAEDKAQRFLETYAAFDNLMITVNTRALFAAGYAASATVCRLNSGSFLYNPRPRGRNSFIPLGSFEYRNKRDTPAELTLDCAIPDLLSITAVTHYPGTVNSSQLLPTCHV